MTTHPHSNQRDSQPRTTAMQRFMSSNPHYPIMSINGHGGGAGSSAGAGVGSNAGVCAGVSGGVGSFPGGGSPTPETPGSTSTPTSLSSCQSIPSKKSRHRKELPPLFWYMEMGDWAKATKRAKTHPREVKTRATLRTKNKSAGAPPPPPPPPNMGDDFHGIALAGSSAGNNGNSAATNSSRAVGTKRFALHHACFKLRSASSTMPISHTSNNNVTQAEEHDVFIQVCKFVLLLIEIYPDAAGMRESRHGCLPLHLAAFASGAPRPQQTEQQTKSAQKATHRRGHSTGTSATLASAATTHSLDDQEILLSSNPSRPVPITARTVSDATADTSHTNMTAVLSEELFAGEQTSALVQQGVSPRSFTTTTPRSHASLEKFSPIVENRGINNLSLGLASSAESDSMAHNNIKSKNVLGHASRQSTLTPSATSNDNKSINQILISAKREEMMVRVINALLDAYPKAIRVDSEGGRLALHTACAGRATPRVISTLVTAYPAAARHRNKDGFLPLHLAAHWGVSHPNVAITLLKAYPDATVGRNRWERTPLEEALCMAGENGRPHQAPMVRALRKHPSYWTRPPQELFNTMRRERQGRGPTIVDMDETIPSNGSDDESNDYRYFNSGYTQFIEEEEFEEVPYETSGTNVGEGGLMSRSSSRNFLGRKNNNQGVELGTDLIELGMNLATLIKNLRWKSVVSLLECNPDEGGQQLNLTTRGGFVASCGMMPLHYACERKPPIEVIQALIEACPEAVSTRMMPGGCLPIHVACTWHASPAVVNELYQADPSTVKSVDELGNRPLHAACFSGAMTQVVESLLISYPKAVLSRNNQGSQPLDIVRRLRHDNKKQVTALLEEMKKKILGLSTKQQHKRNVSDGSWSAIIDEANGLNERDGPPLLNANSYDHIDAVVGGKDMNQRHHPQQERDNLGDIQGPGIGVEVTYDESSPKEGALLWI